MDSNPTLKFAVAVALLRSKLFNNQSPSKSSISSSSSLAATSDAQKWKRKAKERKLELIKLKQDLKDLEDGGDQHDLFPPSACCKCYFFDNLGRLSSVKDDDESNLRINQVLHRRFLRQVRLKERRRRTDESVKRRYGLDLNVDYDTEQLSTSVDYLVELCNTSNSVENRSSFANMSHQAVDFIVVSLKKFAKENKSGCIEGTVNSLVTRVIGRMCTPSPRDESPHSGDDAQLYVHHLLRELGAEPYIGQRIMFAVSQRISVLADSLLFMDPFDDTFPAAHSCMFLLIQLVEFLISDYVQSWTNDEAFEISLFEDWLRSIVQARKALCSLESRNGLYALYMDRVTGELHKQVGQVSCRQSLNPDILENLLISH
ncbi:hypothetical protein ACHQM5_029972 [Ranunculus cassubicifolius]